MRPSTVCSNNVVCKNIIILANEPGDNFILFTLSKYECKGSQALEQDLESMEYPLTESTHYALPKGANTSINLNGFLKSK